MANCIVVGMTCFKKNPSRILIDFMWLILPPESPFQEDLD